MADGGQGLVGGVHRAITLEVKPCFPLCHGPRVGQAVGAASPWVPLFVGQGDGADPVGTHNLWDTGLG